MVSRFFSVYDSLRSIDVLERRHERQQPFRERDPFELLHQIIGGLHRHPGAREVGQGGGHVRNVCWLAATSSQSALNSTTYVLSYN